MKIIINHDHPQYRRRYNRLGADKYNGAFYYSKEICKNIIPAVRTDRNWITINIEGVGCDHAIVFIHNNLQPQKYEWLRNYKDLILVCGVPETCKKVEHLGKAIYLPLSVDISYVEQFRTDTKTKDVAYVGRRNKANNNVPKTIDYLYGMKRQRLLPTMAKFRQIYAVGRCAIEGMILECDILPYDDRFPDPSIWKILDNREAAVMLQGMLDEIDGRKEQTMSMISELVEELIDNADLHTKELHDLMYRAANTIEMLSEKARKPKQEWIPCSERLPNENDYYLVTLENGVVKILGYSTTQRTTYPKGFYYVKDGFSWRPVYHPVVAWMPLPKPWEGADDDI